MAETATLAQRLALLPKYCSYKDVLGVFKEDEGAFIEAWCTGGLSPEIRAVCRETFPAGYLQELLLRRVSKQLGTLIALQQRESNP